MISAAELARISELGRVAGAMPMAQARECPYSNESPDERYAWLAGFSRGRAEIQPSSKAEQAEVMAAHQVERLTRFGSKIVFHHSTKTAAISYLGETRVIGPFLDEETAHLGAETAMANWQKHTS